MQGTEFWGEFAEGDSDAVTELKTIIRYQLAQGDPHDPMPYQRGYKRGMAQVLGLPDWTFRRLPYDDWGRVGLLFDAVSGYKQLSSTCRACPYSWENTRLIILGDCWRDQGRTWLLTLMDLGKEHGTMGRSHVWYRFWELNEYMGQKDGKVLFEGDELYTPHPALSNEAAGALLAFLTLMPGDTDSEHFDAYTPEQRAFATDPGTEYLRLEWSESLGLGGNFENC